MYPTIKDLFKSVVPLSGEQKKKISHLSEYVDQETLKKAEYLLKTNKINMIFSRYGVTAKLFEDIIYPELKLNTKDDKVKTFVSNINKEVQEKVKKRSFKKFSEVAQDKIKEYISPNIYGLDYVKRAAMLQLFSSDPVHVLLLGDPGTGKTDILRSVSDLHPITSFGLGSGTSGAGLGVTIKGKEVVKGLLPRANNGICCIDELNLMKREDYAYLYSAMEKGFITYSKATKHEVFDTKVRILATANPKGDKFVGKMVSTLKKQLPFDQALLSRFHLVFLIRKPDIEGFIHITKKIVDGHKIQVNKKDLKFIQEYVNYAESIDVEFPKDYREEVVDFIEALKRREKEFLIEMSPRIVIGLVRLCKAHARMNLRTKVNTQDLGVVKDLIKNTLVLREK